LDAGTSRSHQVRDAANSKNVCSSRSRPNAERGDELFDRYKDRMPDLALDVLRQVALAGGVLDQDYLTDTDHSALAVTGGNLHPGIEIDDVLSARRRMPVDIVVGLRLRGGGTPGR